MTSATLTPTKQQSTDHLEAPAAEAIVDSLPLLDHGARKRTVSARYAPRGHYLELKEGDERRYVPLADRITHIGRGFTADIRIEQQHISVSHAILVRHGRFMRVLDNRSSNGTYVNGRRIVATNLEDGDVLRVGPVVIRYVVVS